MKYYYTITLVLLIFCSFFYNIVHSHGCRIGCISGHNYQACTLLVDKNSVACQTYTIPVPFDNTANGYFNVSNGYYYISSGDNDTSHTIVSFCPGGGRKIFYEPKKYINGTSNTLNCRYVPKL